MQKGCDVINFEINFKRNQFNLLLYFQNSIKIQSVGRQNNFSSLQFLGSPFWEKKVFFIKRRKTNNIFSAVYFLCKKIEELSWRLARNSKHANWFLYYTPILFFHFVNCLNILPIKNEIKCWMTHLLKGIKRYLNKCKQNKQVWVDARLH